MIFCKNGHGRENPPLLIASRCRRPRGLFDGSTKPDDKEQIPPFIKNGSEIGADEDKSAGR